MAKHSANPSVQPAFKARRAKSNENWYQIGTKVPMKIRA
jgi:hypothetical protein